MLELIATCREMSKRKRRPLEDGDVIVIGRQPADGWAIPWDTSISREHARLTLKKGQLLVKQLRNARNAIRFGKKDSKKFAIMPGQEFLIGKTTFQLAEVDESVQEFREPIGNYAIKKELGEGPMGRLLGAIDQSFRNQVVLKGISDDRVKDSEFVDRFLADAKAFEIAKVGAMALIQDSGFDRGFLFVAREYIEASNLATIIQRQGRIPPKSALDIVTRIARVLESLDEHNLVHLNLKPSNVLYRVGSVTLVDPVFGGNISGNTIAMLQKTGKQFGTVDYMAPEQALSCKAADIRSDLYSLGCIWYEMLTGKPPFVTDSIKSTMRSHEILPVPNPRALCPKFPKSASPILKRLLAKSPDKRFASPHELLAKLEHSDVQGVSVDGQRVEQILEITECPNCEYIYNISTKMSGRKVKCKSCGETFRVQFSLDKLHGEE